MLEVISSNYTPVVIMSYITFMIIFTFVSPTLSSIFSATYPRITQSCKIEWNNRFTSTVFSVVVSSISIYILIVDKAYQISPLNYHSKLASINIAIVMGYILSDMTIILFKYNFIGDLFTILHHIFSVIGYGCTLTFSIMPYFANFRLICELSMPLVNMR